MDVDVGLDQCESSLFALSERLASESVAVVSQLELSGVDSNDGANEEFFLTNLGVDHSLQEHAAVFQVVLNTDRDIESKSSILAKGEWVLTMSIVWSLG